VGGAIEIRRKMKEFIILFTVSFVLALIIANIFGLDWNNARSIADWVITIVLISLAVPFIVMRIQDSLRKNSKK
jgi:uncharacterized membrane protein